MSATLKPHAEPVLILEQIIEDEDTGLTIQIGKTSAGGTLVRIVGDTRFGNLQLYFTPSGELAGLGSGPEEQPRPSWLCVVDAEEVADG